jgi:hypothetical protein
MADSKGEAFWAADPEHPVSFDKHLHFKGFVWDELEPREIGIPAVFHFGHDTRFSIDKIWVALCTPMFIRKDSHGVCFAFKDLAFDYYKAAMKFNSFSRSEQDLLYPNKELLWLAIHIAYKQLKIPASEQARIVQSCHLVIHVENPVGQCPANLSDLRSDAEVAAATKAAQEAEVVKLVEQIIDQGPPILAQLYLKTDLGASAEAAPGAGAGAAAGAGPSLAGLGLSQEQLSRPFREADLQRMAAEPGAEGRS